MASFILACSWLAQRVTRVTSGCANLSHPLPVSLLGVVLWCRGT